MYLKWKLLYYIVKLYWVATADHPHYILYNHENISWIRIKTEQWEKIMKCGCNWFVYSEGEASIYLYITFSPHIIATGAPCAHFHFSLTSIDATLKRNTATTICRLQVQIEWLCAFFRSGGVGTVNHTRAVIAMLDDVDRQRRHLTLPNLQAKSNQATV